MVLIAEHIVSIRFLHGTESADCYFALIPVCIELFSLLLIFQNVSIPHAKTFRICSTVIYVTHKSFLACLIKALEIFEIPDPAWLLFMLTSVLLTLLSLLLIRLSRNPKLSILKILW